MFVYNLVVKTERHILFPHLHLLSSESDTLLFFFLPIGKLCPCFVRLTPNIICIPLLFFFLTWSIGKIFCHLLALPGPLEKNYHSFAGLAQLIGKIISHFPDPVWASGQCRPLPGCFATKFENNLSNCKQ